MIPVFVELLIAPILICALYYLICKFILKERSTLATYLTSVALSLTSSLGVYCAYVHITSKPARNPISYPAGEIGFWVCLVAFLALFVMYVIFRKKRVSFSGICCDVLFALFTLVPFVICFKVLHITISMHI